MKKCLIFLAAVALVLSSCHTTPSVYKKARLDPLNEWLYRSPQPQEEDFSLMKSKGIRTVVNFRQEGGKIDWEKEKVEALGMNYVSLPWTIRRPVQPELLDEFFKVLDDPKNRPVLFHCKHGRDRSGVMSVLALMHYEKMPEEDARRLAFKKVPPHWRYRPFVNQKIKFLIQSRPERFSESASG